MMSGDKFAFKHVFLLTCFNKVPQNGTTVISDKCSTVEQVKKKGTQHAVYLDNSDVEYKQNKQ